MFPLNFIKKWKRKDSIGIEIGSEELKLVQIKPLTQGRFALNYVDSFLLPKEEKEMIPKLKNYVIQHGFEGSPTALAFQDDQLHIRPLQLPRMPREDLIEAIRWQMRDIAEGAVEDYEVQYSVIEEKILQENVRIQLLGFAVKKDLVQRQAFLLQRVGLNPFFLEPTPVALATTIEMIYPSQGLGWIGGLDLEKRRPYFFVIGKGKLHFVRPLPGLMAQDPSSPDYPSKLSVELQHALDAFFITLQTEKIEKIFLAGDGASYSELGPLLTKNLGITTEILNPFQGIEQTEAFPLAKERPHLFGAALGSAFLQP